MNPTSFFILKMLYCPQTKIVHNFLITNQNGMNQSFLCRKKYNLWEKNSKLIVALLMVIFWHLRFVSCKLNTYQISKLYEEFCTCWLKLLGYPKIQGNKTFDPMKYQINIILKIVYDLKHQINIILKIVYD